MNDTHARSVRATRAPTPAGRVAAALVASLAVLAAARVALGAVSPPEIAFEGVARFLGVPAVFNLVHALPFGLDRLAKPALFVVVAVLWLAASWWLGRRLRPWARRLGLTSLAVALVAGAVALVGLVLLPAQGLGWFGLSPSNFAWDPWTTHLAAGASALVFAWIGGAGARRATAVPEREGGASDAGANRSQRSGHDDGRRRAVSILVRGVAVAAAAGPVGGRWLLARAQEAADLFGRLIGLSPRITPVGEHYTVSKNLFDPSVSADGWSLRIEGMVDQPLDLTLADLERLPSVTRPSTLMCVSNPVGGDLIGTSEWTGVRLADLLEMAGPQEGARELVLRAADNYSDSFPLDAALREGTIVAYLQNGEPLTSQHGFPARVLVPGIYGMKNVKWVQSIELVVDDYQGYWQTRGWSDEAVVKTMSRIDTDTAAALGDGRVAVGGIAFAGLRGISAVEVSLDDGATWQAAELEPAPNGLSWRRWAAVLTTDRERFEVRVRATDGDGTVQTEERTRPLPDGADGHHRVQVRVEG
jgi:DMSO/TMAO reductase YedYZ molybdopterin-dependent catalytic subunit